MIGFADISALLSYTGVSIGLLFERYNHHIPYKFLLTNEKDVEEEEMCELNNEKDDNTQDTALNNIIEKDPVLTRLTRLICSSYTSIIDIYLPPKPTAILLLLIFIPNTIFLATIIIHLFDSTRLLYILLITICLIINLIITLIFCLLRPKQQTEKLLFICPGIPVIPLINITIFIFLMVFQDLHDWFGYMCIIILTLFIYFFYGFHHSKAR